MTRFGLLAATALLISCGPPKPAEFPPILVQKQQPTTPAPAPASTDPLDALGLSAEDKVLWATLTPEQQQRAVLFIRNGGTLRSSLGQ